MSVINTAQLPNKVQNTNIILENVAVVNALQLEVARATPAPSHFNYDAMPSLKLLNLSLAVL